ncbi:MAG: pirin family protein, partial [Psychrobacter sp.]|nr:pirin family protein [Psychrobacter sp.]
MRSIKHIHGDKEPHWVGDGFYVKTLFNHLDDDPDFNHRHTDPFLLLDYGQPTNFAPNPNYKTQPHGVGQHPHKGFETVTIAYAGEISHADSAGGYGVIQEGDVQWMTAGRGIMHEEFHSPAFGQRGGPFSMVQL